MAEQRDTLLSVSSVLRDGAEFERTYREVLDELASTRWRYQPGSWATLSASVARDIRAATSAIRVVPRTSTINLLAEKGTLRITVENGLDYTVQDIRLRLVPDNPRIRVVEQPGPVTIGPLSRTNVPVEVAAVAAGRAEIRAYLTTADGTQIGSPATHSRCRPTRSTAPSTGSAGSSSASSCWPVSFAPSSRAPHASTRSPTSRHSPRHTSLSAVRTLGMPTDPPRMMPSHASRYGRTRGG